MSATYMIVTNATANALSLTGDDRKPSVSIARAGTANINIVDVLGNQLLCDTLSTWVTAGTVTITRGGVAVTAAQLTAYKQGADMDRTDYDADDDLVVDAAEAVDTGSRTAVDDTMSPYAVLAGDTMIQTDTTGGTLGLTLPAGVDGKTYIIKDGAGTAGTNAVTITPTVDTIEGEATYALDTAYASIQIYYDLASTDWKLMNIAGIGPSSIHESWQHIAAADTLRYFRATSAGRIVIANVEDGTVAAAAESMTFDVQIGGVSCLTGLITLDNGDPIDTPVAGVIDIAANTFAAGDLVRVVRAYVPGGAPTPMADTVCTIEIQLDA